MEMEAIVQRLTETEQRSKSNTKRLDAMEKRQDDLETLTVAVAEMRKDQEHVAGVVEEIKTDVKALTEKPGKRWEAVVDKIIMLLVGGVIGFFLVKLGVS